ncbi:MAG: hypothetical protein QW727_00815 [Candidatus Pacearchaeota archaeon]
MVIEKKEEKLKRKFTSNYFLGFSLFIFFILFFSSYVTAQTTTVCCEKTLNGAYCQNSIQSQCDSRFLSSQTSCDATSFCQLGVCYDSDDGLCMNNVPQRACEEANGLWTSDANPPQCNLGCCILGQQASFTTLQRCKKLSGTYGLQVDFRTDIKDEVSCIAVANAQDIGACVFESEFTRTCKFVTRAECGTSMNSTNSGVVPNTQFFKDFLCTSEQLNTNCQRTSKTSCFEGEDEVYFIDSCGNKANIYDASRINDKNYWEKRVPKSQSCTASRNSRSCGNCDYLEGSICSKAKDSGVKPAYGEFICRDINCYSTSNGKNYKNGESWCFYDNNNKGDDRVGSRHFRHICFMGEEIVEPCADYRQETCIEDSINVEGGGTFLQAGCVVNRWHDCLLQKRIEDCQNTDLRDCKWIPVSEEPEEIAKGIIDASLNKITNGFSGLLMNVIEKDERDKGACVPDIAPGLEFWGESAASQCDLVSSSCVITYEKTLIGGKKCVKNCFCDIKENPQTAIQALNICSSIGDCGPGANYIGKFVNNGYELRIDDKKIGPELNLGIFTASPVQSGSPANPSTNPSFEQRREFSTATQQTFQTQTSTATSTTGNIIKDIITETYKQLGK